MSLVSITHRLKMKSMLLNLIQLTVLLEKMQRKFGRNENSPKWSNLLQNIILKLPGNDGEAKKT